MSLYRTANVDAVAVYQSSGKFFKLAQKMDNLSDEQQHVMKQSISLITKPKLAAVAKIYNISDRIDDYIFPVYRALRADYPNNNGDNFTHEELSRFSPMHRCQVYATFKNAPYHVEHAASDPKAARGFLPDAHYVTSQPKDRHVLVAAAVDATKDIPLAEGILAGDLNQCSMGCICEAVQCSWCHKVAYSDFELCDCLMHHKMSRINNQLIYEDCLGVEFQELSNVREAAEPTAVEQAILKYASRKHTYEENKKVFSPIASMVSVQDRIEIARFIQTNVNRLPEAMLRLADKLY